VPKSVTVPEWSDGAVLGVFLRVEDQYGNLLSRSVFAVQYGDYTGSDDMKNALADP